MSIPLEVADQVALESHRAGSGLTFCFRARWLIKSLSKRFSAKLFVPVAVNPSCTAAGCRIAAIEQIGYEPPAGDVPL